MSDILMPDPLAGDQQYKRFYHLDLPELEDTELTDEFHYLRAHLWGLLADNWLRERVKALETELYKRRGDTRFEFNRKPRPKSAEGVTL